MSSEDLFIALGLVLVVLALLVSAVGVKSEKFPPSRGVVLAGLGLFAALIGATAVFAWDGAEEEQHHREELQASGEEPTPAEVMEEMLASTEEARLEAQGEEVAAGEDTEEAQGGPSVSTDGAAIFEEQGCAGCHTLSAAGSTGTTGPDLDAELAGENAAFVEESIVDPEAEIAKGYPGGVMPNNYGEELSPEELEALVAYILDSVESGAN
jgi:mono/diheme cytochrome c family protein